MQHQPNLSPIQMTYGQVEPSPPVADLKKRLEPTFIFSEVEYDHFQTEAMMRMMMVHDNDSNKYWNNLMMMVMVMVMVTRAVLSL